MPPEPFGGSDVRLKCVLSRAAARLRLRRILRAAAVATGAPNALTLASMSRSSRKRLRSPRFAITMVQVPLDTTVNASRSPRPSSASASICWRR